MAKRGIPRHPQRGFTLMEMVVSLALVGVLALVAWPAAQVAHQRQQEMELRRSLREVREALDAWKAAVQDGRIASPADASPWPPSLQSLVDGAPDAKSANPSRLVFLRRIPRDPFAPAELSPAETWGIRPSGHVSNGGTVVRFSDEPRRGARDVFDVYSRTDRLALDGSRLAQW